MRRQPEFFSYGFFFLIRPTYVYEMYVQCALSERDKTMFGSFVRNEHKKNLQIKQQLCIS